MKSWKTTAFGVMGAVGGVLANGHYPDMPWLNIVGQVLAALGVCGIGAAARDNDKSSEDVNVK